MTGARGRSDRRRMAFMLDALRSLGAGAVTFPVLCSSLPPAVLRAKSEKRSRPAPQKICLARDGVGHALSNERQRAETSNLPKPGERAHWGGADLMRRAFDI